MIEYKEGNGSIRCKREICENNRDTKIGRKEDRKE